MPDGSKVDAPASKLRDFIRGQSSHDAEVASVERIPGGFSYETWKLSAKWRDEDGTAHDARLIMRKAPRGGVLEPYDPTKEYRVLRMLEGTGVPAPRALWLEASGAVLGTPFYIMEFVEGDVPVPWDPSIVPETRAEMHRQLTEVAARLHTVDWETRGFGFLGIPDDRADPAAFEIARCEAVLERIHTRPHPMLRELIARLHENRPRTPVLSLNHGDYRMGNFVWRDDRIVALLDWERAFIGDPMADIAFTRIKNISGWCSIEGPMAELYSRVSGIQVDEPRVGYQLALEGLKANLVGLTGLNAFAEGRTSDLRLVSIGRHAAAGIIGLADALGVGK